MKKLFNGVCTALITPFKKGQVDYIALEGLLELQIDADVSAILILGTTGESPCITREERTQIIKFCKEKIAGRCKLIVGTGSNCTESAIELTKEAENLGADGVLIVTPYYNKCTQAGLIKHFKEISNNCTIPIIAYNVPSRTGVNIEPETALALSKIENVVGLKEANADVNHITKVTQLLKNRMAVYSGNDNLNYLFMSQGGSGIVSVTSNIFPKLLVKQQKMFEKMQFSRAKALDETLEGVNRELFTEVNPIGIKHAASYLGLCKNELRRPLTPLSKSYRAKLESEIDILLSWN